jgi:hypothetical protein
MQCDQVNEQKLESKESPVSSCHGSGSRSTPQLLVPLRVVHQRTTRIAPDSRIPAFDLELIVIDATELVPVRSLICLLIRVARIQINRTKTFCAARLIERVTKFCVAECESLIKAIARSGANFVKREIDDQLLF